MYLVYNPVNVGYDENGHFLRAYELSKGIFVSDHSEEGKGITYAPKNLNLLIYKVSDNIKLNDAALVYEKEEAYLNKRFDKNDISLFGNENQALYSPASYIQNSLGLFISNIFTDNVFIYYQMGRFSGMLINAILIILALYLYPERGGLICLVASTPIFISQMSTYSADGNLNSISVFYFAYIMHIRKKEKITALNCGVIVGISIIIALSKMIYFPFVFAVFVIPNKLFNDRKKGMIFKVLTSFLAVLVFVIWFSVARTFLSDSSSRGVYPEYQMVYLLKHLYRFPLIVYKTIIEYSPGWYATLFGGNYDLNNIRLNNVVPIIVGLITIYEIIVSFKNESNCNIRVSVCLGAVILIILGLTFSSLYVQWTPYKYDMILGIQGRYFIPLILPFSIAVKKFRTPFSEEIRLIVYMIIMLLINIYSISFMQYVFA